MAGTTKKPKSLEQKLALVREEVGALVKNTQGYNYKYFDINQMLDKLNPILSKHKLLLIQPITENGVTTEIRDLEGDLDTVSSFIPLPSGVDPQKMGSAITYYRRFTLQSLLALSAEDDDGASVSGSTNQQKGSSFDDW